MTLFVVTSHSGNVRIELMYSSASEANQYQNQIFNDSQDLSLLRNHQDARTAVCLNKLPEMTRHCFAVVGNQNPTLSCSRGEDFRIGEPFKFSLICGLKIYFRHPSENARYNVFVKICVGLKANFHDWEVSVSSRARRSFSYQSECVS